MLLSGFYTKMVDFSYYHEHEGKYVMVYTNNNSFSGKMIEDTHSTIKLCPSLISEP